MKAQTIVFTLKNGTKTFYQCASKRETVATLEAFENAGKLYRHRGRVLLQESVAGHTIIDGTVYGLHDLPGWADIPAYEIPLAFYAGGWREQYAIIHGTPRKEVHDGETLYTFEYSTADKYQDANGAIYNATWRTWVG